MLRRRNTTGGRDVSDREKTRRRKSTLGSVEDPPTSSTAWEQNSRALQEKRDRVKAGTEAVKALVKKRSNTSSVSVSEAVQKPLLRLVSHVTPARAFAAPTPPHTPVSTSILLEEIQDGLSMAGRGIEEQKDKLRTAASFRSVGGGQFRRMGSAFQLGSDEQSPLSRTNSHMMNTHSESEGEVTSRGVGGGTSSDERETPRKKDSWSGQFRSPSLLGANLHNPLSNSIQSHTTNGNSTKENVSRFEMSVDAVDVMELGLPRSSLKQPSSQNIPTSPAVKKVASFRLHTVEERDKNSGSTVARESPTHRAPASQLGPHIALRRRSSQSRQSVIAIRNKVEKDKMYNRHFDNVERYQYTGIGEIQCMGGKVLDEYHAEMHRMQLEEEKDNLRLERVERYQEQLTQWNASTTNHLPPTILARPPRGTISFTTEADTNNPDPIEEPPKKQRSMRAVSLVSEDCFGPMEVSTMRRPSFTASPPTSGRRNSRSITLVDSSGSEGESSPQTSRRASIQERRRRSSGSLADQLYGRKDSQKAGVQKSREGCADESFLAIQRDQRNKKKKQKASSISSPASTKPSFTEDRHTIKARKVLTRSLEGSEYLERVCIEDREKRALKDMAVQYLVAFQRVLDMERAQLLADRESDRQSKRDTLLALGFTDAEIEYRWDKELKQGMMQRTRPAMSKQNSFLTPSPPGSQRNLSLLRDRTGSDLGSRSPSWRRTPRSASPKYIPPPKHTPPSLRASLVEEANLESGGESSAEEDEGPVRANPFDDPNPYFDVFLSYEESAYNDQQAIEEVVLDEPCAFPVYIAIGAGHHSNFLFIKEMPSRGNMLSKRNSGLVDDTTSAPHQSLKKQKRDSGAGSEATCEGSEPGVVVPHVMQGAKLIPFDLKTMYALLKQDLKIQSTISGARTSYRRVTTNSRSPTPQMSTASVVRRVSSPSTSMLPPVAPRRQASETSNKRRSSTPSVVAPFPVTDVIDIQRCTPPLLSASRAGSFQRASPPMAHVPAPTTSTTSAASNLYLQVSPPRPTGNSVSDGDTDSCFSNTARSALSPCSPAPEDAFGQTQRGQSHAATLLECEKLDHVELGRYDPSISAMAGMTEEEQSHGSASRLLIGESFEMPSLVVRRKSSSHLMSDRSSSAVLLVPQPPSQQRPTEGSPTFRL